MPTLKRLCTAPGCGYTATQGSSYCKAHKAHSVARAAMRKRAADKRRPSANARGYDRDWRRVRGAYLKANPICKRDGCSERATEVHHKVALADGGARLKWSNLEGLCSHHHKQHEADAQRGEGGRFKARWS